MPLSPAFRCFLVEKSADGNVSASVRERPTAELPPGEVTIRVLWSSLNYKDAMAATGHPGITRNFPHVPGIDAAGVVVETTTADFPIGTEVIATGHELGVERWGGWSEFVRVPAEWLIRRPETLTLEESMTIGTAGFTAAQSVYALQRAGIRPDSGPVVVTGATGGVGSLAVQILSQLGYDVTAVTGKRDQEGWLNQIGARNLIDRDQFLSGPSRPLWSATWAGGIDTVGGMMLATLVKSVQHRGCVTACGVVGGSDLPLTVYPFILRGVTLAGIDSAWCPEDRRSEIWNLLATDWKPKYLDLGKTVLSLDQIPAAVDQMLRGGGVGRTVIRI